MVSNEVRLTIDVELTHSDRVSAIRMTCGTMFLPKFSGEASPIPEKCLPSSISAVAFTIATLPLPSLGTWM